MNPPLIFLPGWGLGRGPLQRVAQTLDGQILDLPGYGEMPRIDDFSSAVALLADRLDENTTLVGWSLGAQMAMAIAAQSPEKVGRLVLVAGTASFIQRDGWPHAMPPAMLAEFTAGIAADPEGMLPRFVGGFNRGDWQAKAVTRALLDVHDPLPAASTLVAGLTWLRDVDLREQLARIKAPTLLIHGSADPLMPAGAAQALASAIAQARLSLFSDCAHAPFISRPDDFIACLHAFINEPTA